MNLTELSVRRPVTGVMVFLCLTILGLFTFSRLKLDMLPNIEFPLVAIITQYPGAGPDSMEQLVTRPIEEAMASVENVEDINSTSNQGNSIVMVKFAWGTDMQTAEQDVRKNLEIFAQDRLPDDVERPLTFAFDPALQPVVFLTVNAPGTPHTVRKLAEDMVEPYLARIAGVASAEVIGGTKREIQVRLDPAWLESYGISAQQVVSALRGANVMIPGGRLDQGRQELSISTNAEFRTVEQVRDVVVGQKGGERVYLRDVAEVVDTFEEETAVVRADGRHAVMMAVRKQSDANTVQVARRVMKEMEQLQKRLPEGVSLVRVFDQGLPITRALSNLSDSALLAIFLTAAVLLAFLRSWRTSSIVLVSIPLSLLATFAVMDFQGVTMNIISMAGLALAVGMLVDNSIVVLENVFTHLGQGKGPKEAAIDGTREMAMPIAASTLTTVAVFAPILFVPGLAGQLFRDMSLTICISLLASLVVALTLVPLMASLMALGAGQNRLERWVGRFTTWLDPLSERYAVLVGKAMRNRGKVMAGTLLIFIATMAMTPLLGVDFMPKTDNGELRFSVKASPGTSLWTTDSLFKQVEAIVHAEVPEAEVVVSQFGGGEGFAALFGQNSYTGNVQVRLPPRAERERSQQQIENVLVERFKGLAGLEVLPQQQGMMGAGGDVVVKVFGDDLMKVRDYGARLKSRLEVVPGASNVTFSMEQGQPELKVDLDRDQIRLLGLAPAEVASTVSTYFLGTTATMFREGGDEYRVFVRAPKEVREDVRRLRALPVSTPLGVTVPLETVASIHQSLGPTAISRENQRRLATINLSANGVALGTLIQKVNETLTAMGEEPGITTMVAGTAEDLQDSFMALGLAFVVAVLLVYMVMASQFESLLEPFVILFSVPLAISGVVLALVISRTTLQVTALIGIILLAGVVVNNGIVLIDVLKTRRLEGQDLVLAAVEAGRSRLRPILMTTLTTVLGMVPLAFELGDGAEMWAPMARAVIGGMTVSTLLTLLVIPVGYVSLAGWVDRRRARKVAPSPVVSPVAEQEPRPASNVG
ncbi:efflux RND transporter permease subunit [Archangium lipolyticum]|uniref:efflux RND transporter permease subunit n=1 Tax=Archangium lipolyticum TaxID=2970465 RepID=UPI002149BC86|nr:efflux RND transporter permease subunit [Archangium lipolyticum]